jgi:hypothetical protein
MSHIRIDKQKATKKWAPVLENMGVTGDRVEWMAEYAEFHSINENAYANATTAGMGAVTAPQPGGIPGYLSGGGAGFGPGNYLSNGGGIGSGDLGQNLLPVAMKIAAQTIGLDLVAVKPTPGPKIDLLYIDFQYDDLTNGTTTGRPQVFKITSANGSTDLTNINATLAAKVASVSGASLTTGGVQGARVWAAMGTASTIPGFPNLWNNGALAAGGLVTSDPTTTSAGAAGWAEFLGFSRIDGYPMFKAYRQANSGNVGGTFAPNYPYAYDQTLNTFGPTGSLVNQIAAIGATTSGTVVLSLISALEDQLPGFSANWEAASSSGDYPMDRATDDNTYAGIIGPKISSKSIAVGTIEVSTALRRTEIEDIKANTGMDIVQKMESILVNELSQTISKQIVAKIFELGETNRSTAPLAFNFTTFVSASASTIFDLNTAYAANTGGETTHAVQRKLITKMAHASNYIATEGRVGPAQFAVTNGGLAAALMDIAGYTINPVKSKMNGAGQLYPVGTIGDIQIYVDPYMRYNDNRIVLGRKNNPDQPGLIFVPYLMAQSISVISEATFAPRMLLRSRYAIADVGFFPQKQYMTIKVIDNAQLLN